MPFFIRILLCFAFIVSLYGGMALLTALMFAKGNVILAIVSGLVLTAMTAMALGLFGLAWATISEDREDDITDLAVHSG